jgi:hypothetical protein
LVVARVPPPHVGGYKQRFRSHRSNTLKTLLT